MPARPYTPTAKGKVEAGVKYVKNNALKGKNFESLAKVNAHLRWWLTHVADQRIHDSTKRQVSPHFLEDEKPVLKPLPPTLFSCYEEARRSVHRDNYIEVKGSYYEVPAQYIGQRVWVRWDVKMIRIFDHQMKPVVTHARIEPGKFTQVRGVGGSRGSVEQSVGYYRRRVVEMGKPILTWADAMIAQDSAGALRRLQGLLDLRKKYSKAQSLPLLDISVLVRALC